MQEATWNWDTATGHISCGAIYDKVTKQTDAQVISAGCQVPFHMLQLVLCSSIINSM